MLCVLKDAILTLDIGTTVAKAVLFDLQGSELAVHETKIPLYTPQPGWVEQDAEEIWQTVLKLMHKALTDIRDQANVIAISLATQGGSVVPVLPNGQAVNPLITWMDGRSQEIVQGWHEHGTAEHIRSICGWTPQPGLPLPSIVWLLRHKPQRFDHNVRWLSLNDFLIHRLTGEFCTNPSMAGEMLLLEMGTGHYSDELCSMAGIRSEQLSPILPSASIVGFLKEDFCHLLGLRRTIPLINGGQDHCCEALAVNMTERNTGLLACGTAWVINAVTDSPSVNAIPPQMNVNEHVIPDRWVVSQFLGAFGATMEWWVKQVWQNHASRNNHNHADRFATINQALQTTEAGSKGLFFLPQPVGEGGSFVSMQLSQTCADMTRAVMEGCAYEVKKALWYLSNSNLNVERLWMIGGASRSVWWRTILANVTGIPVLLSPYSHGPALGAAILACQALGIHSTLRQSLEIFKIEEQVVHPVPDQVSMYQELYPTYVSYARRLTR